MDSTLGAVSQSLGVYGGNPENSQRRDALKRPQDAHLQKFVQVGDWALRHFSDAAGGGEWSLGYKQGRSARNHVRTIKGP